MRPPVISKSGTVYTKRGKILTGDKLRRRLAKRAKRVAARLKKRGAPAAE